MMSREAKTAWQRRQRAMAAIAAGRVPHRTGRPPTGRRAPTGRGDIVAQRARAAVRRAQRAGDNGTVLTHPLLDEAHAIAVQHVKPDHGAVIYQPLHEDAVGTAALALVEGHDAHARVRAWLRAERAWLRRTAPLMFEGGTT